MQGYNLTRHLVLALATVSIMCGVTAQAQTNADDLFTQRSADGIAAVVNDEVITLRNVEVELDAVTKNLKAQKIPMPDYEVLQKQVLQRLIDERLLLQEARQMQLNPEAININEAAEMVALRNEITIAQLRKEVEKGGLTWDDYLSGLRQEILMDQIRQRVIDPSINVSETEIDIYLKNQGFDPNSTKTSSAPNEVLELAQILVRIPDGASSSTVAELGQKANSLLQQIRQGADFAGLAASSSDGPEALSGGNMGARPLEGWPDAFATAVQQVSAGEVTDVIRSGAGFHIIKVINKGFSQAQDTSTSVEQPLIVTQTKARHILLRLNEITTDARAEQQINEIASRIKNGESFEDLARAYSEDATAPQGGDLGWLHPGETVPAFEQAMNDLQIGEVSAPIRTQFGWHLIRAEERRERNVGDEYRRMQARQILHERRVEPAFDDWFSRVRSQAFIDNRLDPEMSSRRRN